VEDEPPSVWFKPLPTPEGERVMKDYYMMKRLTRDDLHRLLDDYYDERGWSIETGIPTRETLRRLELEECVKDLPVEGNKE